VKTVRITAISDTHLAEPELPGGDILLIAGDITYRGRTSEIAQFNRWLEKQPYRNKVLVAGNHDFMFEEYPVNAQQLIPATTHYLEDELDLIDGVSIWGSPITPWFHDWAFNRERGDAIAKYWEKIPAGIDILVTHGPPYGILDGALRYNALAEHVGCEELMKHVKRVKPKYHIFGHIHAGYGQMHRHGTTFLNVSIMNEKYHPVNKPMTFDFEVNDG